jgi:hypothetical protein
MYLSSYMGASGGESIRRQPRKTVAAVLGLMALTLAGCPLPFQFAPEGWPAAASAADPSTPGITAAPVVLYSQSSGAGGTLSDGQTGATDSDTTVTLATDTVGAAVYYSTDGSQPDPRSAQTRRYAPSAPISLSVANPTAGSSSADLSIKAIAIGPNMKPSIVTSAAIHLQYPRVAAPAFSPDPGTGPFTTDLSISLTSTAGAAIYYTLVSGAGPAPNPVPGQGGTTLYSGPIAVTGPSATVTIAAIAVKDQLIDSPESTGTFTVLYPQEAPPTFSPGVFFSRTDMSVTLVPPASDPTAQIYFRTVAGTGPAPQPVPGQGGTFLYSLPLSVLGPQNTITIAAIARNSGKRDSDMVSATYTVDYLQTFATVTQAEIAAAEPSMSNAQIANNGANRLPVGQVILYKTSSGNFGKLVITTDNFDGIYGMLFSFVTYAADASVLASNTSAQCRGTWLFDLDSAPSGLEGTGAGMDFWMENISLPTTMNFSPAGGAKFYLGGDDPAY